MLAEEVGAFLAALRVDMLAPALSLCLHLAHTDGNFSRPQLWDGDGFESGSRASLMVVLSTYTGGACTYRGFSRLNISDCSS